MKRWKVFDSLGREIDYFKGDTAQDAIQSAKNAGYKDAAIAEKIPDEPEEPASQWHPYVR